MACKNEEIVFFSGFPMRLVENDIITIGHWIMLWAGFHLLNLDAKVPSFHARLIKFGWAPLTKAPPTALSLGEGVLRCHAYCLIGRLSYVICIHGFKISLNATTINEAVEVPEVSNVE